MVHLIQLRAQLCSAILGLTLVVFVLPPRSGWADDTVEQLIAKMDDADFDVREAATAELVKRVRAGQLTPPGVAAIRDAGTNPNSSPELQIRTSFVFGEFVTQQPSFQKIKTGIGAAITEIDLSLNPFDPSLLVQRTEFSFNSAKGSDLDKPGEGKGEKIVDLSEKAGRALLRGDAAGAAQSLAGLKDFIASLTDFDVLLMSLKTENDDTLTKDAVLALITDAIGQLPALKTEIENGAGPTPGTHNDVPVDAPGDQGTGRSFRLNIEELEIGGELDIYIQPQGQETILPPPGFLGVGHAFHLSTEGILRIGGTVAIGFEFGDVQLFGGPILDPDQLRIFRYAGGAPEFLTRLSLLDGSLVGSYETGAGDLNQFGTFLLVAPVPEPASGLLLLGCVAVLLRLRPNGPRQLASGFCRARSTSRTKSAMLRR
jgi:hypothetical protein